MYSSVRLRVPNTRSFLRPSTLHLISHSLLALSGDCDQIEIPKKRRRHGRESSVREDAMSCKRACLQTRPVKTTNCGDGRSNIICAPSIRAPNMLTSDICGGWRYQQGKKLPPPTCISAERNIFTLKLEGACEDQGCDASSTRFPSIGRRRQDMYEQPEERRRRGCSCACIV